MGNMFKTSIKDYFKGKSVLITGGTGYVASNILSLLKEVDCRVIAISRSGNRHGVSGGAAEVVWIEGDICDNSTWSGCLAGIDVVFHLAAQTSAYFANEHPHADFEANVLPMIHILETCRQQALNPFIVLASTVTICGIPSSLPVNEDHADDPLTIYDLHKLSAERYLKCYIKRGIARGSILRLPNIYGPGPHSSQPDRGILNQMIRKALSGEALQVYKPGGQIRDYLYVTDAASAFLHAALRMESVNGGHFIIGSGQGHSLYDAAKLVADTCALKTGNRVEVKLVDPPFPQSPIESRNFVADSRKFSAATGWKALHQLSEGVVLNMESNV